MPVLLCLFVFLIGSCVGSFLNVLIYRLPRHISIVSPRSHCPRCGHPIGWYDNIPLLSWFLLGRACRHCGQPIRATYLLVELACALGFTLIFIAYMLLGLREGMPLLAAGPQSADWAILALHLWFISALLAASIIDFQCKVIPLSITSLTVGVAVLVHALFPQPMLWRISAPTAGLTVGGCLGLIISAVLLRLGIFRPTFGPDLEKGFVRRSRRRSRKHASHTAGPGEPDRSATVSARREMPHEILYLSPPAALAIVGWLLTSGDTPLAATWQRILVNAHLNALAAALFGFLIGGAIVWLTRILGTLAFGREAMGLGDVHLMAAGGAVLGWLGPLLAFFIAPFFGLLAVVFSTARQRAGELPYGPWLSLGLLTVILFQDKIWAYVGPGLQILWELLRAG